MTPPATKTLLRQRLLNGLEGVALVLTAKAQARLLNHADSGALYRSVGHTRRRDDVLWGSSAKPAPFLEYGFRPHWVAGRYINGWMRRKGVGVIRRTISRGKNKGKPGKITAFALGVFVGGPGSTLESSPQGATGRIGWRRQVRTYRTAGGTSPYLKAGTVGYPFLRPAVAQTRKSEALQAFARGYKGGV